MEVRQDRRSAGIDAKSEKSVSRHMAARSVLESTWQEKQTMISLSGVIVA